LGGSIAPIMVIKVWPRNAQLGDNGQLLPLFGPPPMNPAQQQPAQPEPALPPQLGPSNGAGPQSNNPPGPVQNNADTAAIILRLAALLAATKLVLQSPSTTTTASPPSTSYYSTTSAPLAMLPGNINSLNLVEDSPPALPPSPAASVSRSSNSAGRCGRRPRVGIRMSALKNKR